MPVHHVKDIPAVSYRTWYELTDEEVEAIAAVFDEFDAATDSDSISLSDGVGPGATPGETIRIPVYVDEKSVPDELHDRVEEAVLDADIASYVTSVRLTSGPFTVGHGGPKQYRTSLDVSGGWNGHEHVEH